MEFKNCITEIEDGIMILTHNRPAVLNAMDIDSWISVREAVEYFESQDDLKVLIITGAGDKAFIAGADINLLVNRTIATGIDSTAVKLVRTMYRCPKVIIAAINGYALGGGFEVALACDMRVVGKNAKLGLPETGLGILPGSGGTQRLTDMAGVSVAKDVILGGRTLTADDAYTFGIAYKVVDPADTLAEAKKLARKVMDKAPLSIKLAKKAVDASAHVDIETGLVLENLAYAALRGTEDKKEGTTAFLEKRKAVFKAK